MKALETELSNNLAEIPRLAQRVDAFIEKAGLPPKVAFELNLCLDELLTNTITYGYSDGETHRIAVTVAHHGEELSCEIQDDAAPFDPTQHGGSGTFEGTLEDRPVGGLGIRIVCTLMDEVQYQRHEGGNHLLLRKLLTSPSPLRS